jgi:hypothetical protein
MIDIAKLFKDPTFKFSPQEFVHPSIITSVGLERCLYYISDFQVNYAMLLREILQAPVIINTWHYKKPGPGYYVGRGTRPRSYKPAGGGELSMHYFASALDVSSPAYTPAQIFDAINANEARFRAIGLTTIEALESTPGWIHGDCRRIVEVIYPKKGFLIVKPV